MDIDKIVKLLKSDNEADYTLGYELLIHEYKKLPKCNDILSPYEMHLCRQSSRDQITMVSWYKGVRYIHKYIKIKL